MTVKPIRNTPRGRDNISSAELDTEFLKIEDHLKLNFQARKRFRKLLFPLNEELNDTSIKRDITSPTTQKLKTTTSASLIPTKKKKKVLLHQTSLSNYEKLTQENNFPQKTLQRPKTSDLRPQKVKNIKINNKNELKKTLTQETITNMFPENSMILQTSKKEVAYPIALKSIACCNDLTQR